MDWVVLNIVGNVVEIVVWVCKNDFKFLLVVISVYYLLRVVNELLDVLFDVILIGYLVFVVDLCFDCWYRELVMFKFFICEYVKYMVVWFWIVVSSIG